MAGKVATKRRPKAKKQFTKTKRAKIQTVEDEVDLPVVAPKEGDSAMAIDEATGDLVSVPLATPEDINAKLDKINHWAQDVEGAEREVSEAERTVDSIKKELKDAKADYDAKVANLRRLVRNRQNGQMGFNFPTDDAASSDAAKTDGQQSDAWWRDVMLDTLIDQSQHALPAHIVTKLHEANIDTLGQLADWTAPLYGNRRLTDIEDIGPAAAEKISEATIEWYATHQPPLAEAAGDVATGDELGGDAVDQEFDEDNEDDD